MSYLPYQFTLKAADQNGEAVTEMLFWDGPDTGLASYKDPGESVVFENCGCCFADLIPMVRCIISTNNTLLFTSVNLWNFFINQNLKLLWRN